MRKVIPLPSLPAPRFRYSPCIKAGPFYQLAGLVAIDPASSTLTQGGVEPETRTIMNNFVKALGDLGMSWDNLVSATIYTTKLEQFSLINKVWEEFFKDGITPPARTSIGVAALPLGASVEIEFRLYKE